MRAFGGNARRYRAETIKPDDKALDFIRHLNPYTVFEKIGYSEIAEHACAGRTSNDRNAKSFLLLNKTDLADFSSDEKEFIILHEMGHVVNGDLKWFHSLPYKAKNITFLAGVFVLANHFFIRSNLLFVDNLSTRRMMLCSLIALALNSALQRSKEYKADLWAIKNGAKKNAVEKFLSGKIDEEENESNNFFSYFDYMIFSDHPYSKDRIDAIQKHTPQEP